MLKKLSWSALALFCLFRLAARADDDIVVPAGSGKAYIRDNDGHLFPLRVGYTTDGNGVLQMIPPTGSGVDDTIIANSGKMFLSSGSNLYPAEVLYTTDGNGHIQPIAGGGGSGGGISIGTGNGLFLSGSSSSVLNLRLAGVTTTGALASSDFNAFRALLGGATTLSVSTSFTIPTLSSANYILKVISSGGPRTVTLPDAVASLGHCAKIKAPVGNVNAVTLATQSGQTIDGVTSDVLNTVNEAREYCPDTGGNWMITN